MGLYTKYTEKFMQIGKNSVLHSEKAYSYPYSSYTGALFLIFSHQITRERGFVKKAEGHTTKAILN